MSAGGRGVHGGGPVRVLLPVPPDAPVPSPTACSPRA